jgi:GNAT superfamily N-acetyltransferase
VIRVLEPADVEAVSDVLGLARLHQGDGDYLVAWDGAAPLGHLHLTRSTPPEIQDVEVREDRRGEGVASALLDAAEAACRARGEQAVRVTVSVDNDVARRLYGSRGYADCGVPPRRVRGPVEIRTGTIHVDDTLLTLEKPL